MAHQHMAEVLPYRQGLLLRVGYGSVEKAVDVIVSRRFKCRGMSWLRPGAQGMLKLKPLRFNDDWDTHWAGRFSEAA